MTPLDAVNGRKGRIPARFLNPRPEISNRDCYALLERVAQVTGRDAQRLLQAAGEQAKSDRAAKIAPLLRQAETAFINGTVLDWLPAAAPALSTTQVRFFDATEEENWL